MRIILIIIICILNITCAQAQKHFQTKSGEVRFLSDAPLEIIKAKSNRLRAIIDFEKNTFAFVISMNTFKGFNSPLQKDHFNENYLETFLHPNATFSGKIIEKDALSKKGEVTLRAKGKLKIHGTEEERIIKCNVIIREKSIQVDAFFTVFLDDHNIKIPKIVYQKISEEIKIYINANLILVE